MKNLAIFFFLISFGISAQKVTETIIKSDVKKIKLFLTSGQMTHETEVKLEKGRNKLIFAGISAFADPQSIQFTNNKAFRLVSVSTEMDFLAAEQFNPRISNLKDSLTKLLDKLQANADIQSSYQAELGIMNTNRDLKGANQNLTVAQIKEAGEYYRTRTLEINTQLSKLNKESAELNTKIEGTRYKLAELNFNENQRSNQVIILIESDVAEKATIGLTYLVSDCGWAATYDLTATDVNQKVNLKYKAQVYNNTGNEWKDVDLTLSTADPLLSASQPILSPWYLDYYTNISGNSSKRGQDLKDDYLYKAKNDLNIANQRVYDGYILNNQNDIQSMTQSLELNPQGGFNPVFGQTNVQMRQIEISELSTEFEIKNTFSCPSDAKPYIVDVKEYNLDATYSYVTVPKLDQGTFLIANIVDWQELDLVPGPTNVYFGGMYVGVSEIDTRNTSDTLALSLGRDSKVVVARKLKKEVSSKKVIGSTKKETYLYEISLRNNRSTPITIDVFDQIPIARNTDITVTADEISGATKDPLTGELKWQITIQPGEAKSLDLGFSVKYPKDGNVSVQKYRSISAPSF